MLIWDATCPNTFAPSHVHRASNEAGAIAENAEKIKEDKRAHLDINIEISGV